MSVASIVDNCDHTIITCTAHDSVLQAAKLLSEKKIGALPVLDGSKVAGIFSERDLLNCIASEGANALQRPVGELMTAPAITIEKNIDALKALSLMTKRRIRHLPVMEGDAMIGFVSIGDLVKYRMDRIEAEAEQMRDYITHA